MANQVKVLLHAKSFVKNKELFVRIVKRNSLFFKGLFTIYPMMAPAMTADIKEAIVPPMSARIPKRESTLRCPGASEPIPPI
jgi:hypothetical protein